MRERTRHAGAAGAAVVGAGVSVGATAAAACCIGPVAAPLIVGLLGAGGAAWAASLRPYSLYILAAALIPLAGGFWLTYRGPADAREGGAPSCRPRPPLWLRLVLWSAAMLWVVSLGLNLVLPT